MFVYALLKPIKKVFVTFEFNSRLRAKRFAQLIT
jgi:hypothetical protein